MKDESLLSVMGCRIGEVARRTGIRPDTIRAWERRYSVVTPLRGPNANRYYTRDHVRRLLMIKRLVDSGQAISMVSRLTDDQLAERSVALCRAMQPLAGWVVVSRQQPEWLRQCMAEHPTYNIVWHAGLDELGVLGNRLLIIDMPSLSEQHEREITHHVASEYASQCLVVYQFASRTELRALSGRGFKLLKGPLTPRALANHLL